MGVGHYVVHCGALIVALRRSCLPPSIGSVPTWEILPIGGAMLGHGAPISSTLCSFWQFTVTTIAMYYSFQISHACRPPPFAPPFMSSHCHISAHLTITRFLSQLVITISTTLSLMHFVAAIVRAILLQASSPASSAALRRFRHFHLFTNPSGSLALFACPPSLFHRWAF